MIGVGLLILGITIIINGLSRMVEIDKVTLGILNLLAGSIYFIINTLNLVRGDYYSAGTGYLFAVSYILFSVLCIFSLDNKIYGLYSLLVSITTIPSAIMSIYVDHDIRFFIIWLLWGMLWGASYIEINHKKKLGVKWGYITIFVGISTCWIPGYLMIAGFW